MGIHSEAALNRKFVEFAKLLNIYLNHFPRAEKYALANLIRSTAYEVYDYITEGQKRYHKKTTLTNLDIAHERLRMQLHLANELGYFQFKDGKTSEESPCQLAQHRHTSISKMVDELGGWIQNERQANKGSASKCRRNNSLGSENPVFAKRPGNALVANASCRCPVLSRHGFAVNLNQYRPALVSRLFATKRPLAIILRIAPIIIDALNRVFCGWGRPHVSNKCGERPSPSITNSNPPMPVVFPRWIVRILTSLNHIPPAPIKRIAPLGIGVATCSGRHRIAFSAKATTRLDASVSEIRSRDFLGGPAVTPTYPCFASVPSCARPNYQQATKAVISQVNHFRHSSLCQDNTNRRITT